MGAFSARGWSESRLTLRNAVDGADQKAAEEPGDRCGEEEECKVGEKLHCCYCSNASRDIPTFLRMLECPVR